MIPSTWGSVSDWMRIVANAINAAFGQLFGSDMGQAQRGSTNALDVSRRFSGFPDGTTQLYGRVERLYAEGSNNIDFARHSYNGTHLRTTAGVAANFEGEHRYIWHEGLGGTVANAMVYGGHVRVDGNAITGEVDVFRAVSSTLGASATINRIVAYSVGDIGDATRVTDAFGLDIPDLAAAASVIGVRSAQTAGSNKYGLAFLGNVQSVHLGKLSLGKTSAPSWPLDVAGNVALLPDSSATPLVNGQMVFELTSNTQLKIKVKGSDGTVRSASLTLS